ncbi:thermophilic serine proteinase [Abditibacteriota bacterium]|nr:thermophilic serine proteinase [Abditibacteriota bacterium]
MKPFSSPVWRWSLSGLALLGTVAVPLSQVHADPTRAPRGTTGQVAGKLILRFDDSVSAQEKRRILAQVGGVVKHTYSTGWVSVQVPQTKTTSALKALETNAKVMSVEPNYRWKLAPDPRTSSDSTAPTRQSRALVSGPVPNDPYYPKQWALQKISAPQAWKTTTGSNDVIVAVLDTGVFIDHQDLKNNIWTNPNEIPGNGIDDDKNGFVDDVHGWNGLESNGNVSDQAGHGTACASVIGASGNNGKLMTGINWRIKIIPIRFTSDGVATTTEAFLEDLDYIVALRKKGVKLRAVNCSFGAPLSDLTRPLIDSFKAVSRAGALMVCAAGNANTNIDESAFFPATVDAPNIISVGASDYSDNKRSYSNYGVKSVDIFAPANLTFAGISSDTSIHDNGDGTSIATPVIVGAIGLLCARTPSLTAPQIKQRLLASATRVEQLRPYAKDGLRVNLGTLLDNAVHKISGVATTTQANSSRPIAVAGISIYLDKTSGTPDAVTDSRGRYTIYGVKGGTHTVRAISGISAFGTSIKITLPTDKNAEPVTATANFATQTPSSSLYFIAGRVLQTLPRYQSQPRANIDIYLNDSPVPFARSNEQGWWKISNLPPGAYSVRAVDSQTGEVAPQQDDVVLPLLAHKSSYDPYSPNGYVVTTFPLTDHAAPSVQNVNIQLIYTPDTAPKKFTGTLVDNTGVDVADFQFYRSNDDTSEYYDWNSGKWLLALGTAPSLHVEGNRDPSVNFDIDLPQLDSGYSYELDITAADVFGNVLNYGVPFSVLDSSASAKSAPPSARPKSSAPGS